MGIKVYNSLTKKKEEFLPLEPYGVKMYVCGPTVYDLSHIGHARSAIAFDVIYRYLKYRGYDVTYTRNYTDVDDKIIERAQREGTSTEEVSERYIKAYDEDMAALGVSLPTHRPRATETIPEMIEAIEGLIEKGYAYVVDGDVYYSVRKFQGYGKLSGKNIEELEAGARVEVDERKKDPLDFALWKKSKQGEPWWESPWGRGRPGWHIECSAMCIKYLGETIDIHGGGKDLIFPHHENEIAQSEALTGKPFARYWLHNGFVNIEKEKMSKSLGNILTIRDALKLHTPESIRLFVLSSHYRSPVEYSHSTLKEAEAKAERFYRTLLRIKEEFPQTLEAKLPEERLAERLKPFLDAMDDDFNTAHTIGLMFEEVSRANKLLDSASGRTPEETKEELSAIVSVFGELSRILGVFERSPEAYFTNLKSHAPIPVEEINALIKEREEARKRRDYARADAIRDELKEKGIILEDTPEGTRWFVR
ncbi:MAG TPA: cysteine--tRNA ligase [Deltaproteobacteria bacterium]|nr:cysteine--tRNA ligase [Deltaproteobacteria bacterium]